MSVREFQTIGLHHFYAKDIKISPLFLWLSSNCVYNLYLKIVTKMHASNVHLSLNDYN